MSNIGCHKQWLLCIYVKKAPMPWDPYIPGLPDQPNHILLKIVINFHESSRNIMNFMNLHKLSKIIMNCHEFIGIIMNYHELSLIDVNHHELS